jgi:hypothetical protein
MKSRVSVKKITSIAILASVVLFLSDSLGASDIGEKVTVAHRSSGKVYEILVKPEDTIGSLKSKMPLGLKRNQRISFIYNPARKGEVPDLSMALPRPFEDSIKFSELEEGSRNNLLLIVSEVEMGATRPSGIKDMPPLVPRQIYEKGSRVAISIEGEVVESRPEDGSYWVRISGTNTAIFLENKNLRPAKAR